MCTVTQQTTVTTSWHLKVTLSQTPPPPACPPGQGHQPHHGWPLWAWRDQHPGPFTPTPSKPIPSLSCLHLTPLVGTGRLCFTVPCGYCDFDKLRVWGNPASSKPISAILPTTFSHFVSLRHSLVILEIFQTFSLVLYSLCFCDQWSLMLLPQLTEGSDDGLYFLAIKYFNASAHIALLDVMLLHT